MTAGLGTCPERITVTVPMVTPSLMQFTPWATVLANDTYMFFHHDVLDIPPPTRLNKSVLRDLDTTFNTIDGHLTHSLEMANDGINHIYEQPDATMANVGYTALGLNILSCLISFSLMYFFCKTVYNVRLSTTGSGAVRTHLCPGCQRPRSAIHVPHTVPEGEGADV